MNCDALTERQREVISNADRFNVSAFAVAGSGKTTVLVCLYLRVIDSLIKKYGNINKALDKVLVITFTDDAATEIKKRIMEQLQIYYDYIGPLNFISTIHSFATKILKNVSVRMGIDPEFQAGNEYLLNDLKNSTFKEIAGLIGKDELEKIMDYINPVKIGRNEISLNDIIFILYDKTKVLGWDIQRTISSIREIEKHFQDPDDARKNFVEPLIRIFVQFFNSLESRKKMLGILSYDDILYYANAALESSEIYQAFSDFDYIIVDEFQDTSYIQQSIINKISRNSRLIFAGDFFQSIYEWRDATPVETIKNIKGGNFVQVEMNENFRSVPEIIYFVNSLFTKIFKENLPWVNYINIVPMEKELEGGGVFIMDMEKLNSRERHRIEAENFAKAIINLLKNGKVRENDGSMRNMEMGDIAILFRSRAYMKLYADALRSYGLKFTYLDRENFFQTLEINVLMDLMQVLASGEWKNINDYRVVEILSTVYGLKIESDYDEGIVKKYMEDMRVLSEMLDLKKEKLILEFLKRTDFDIKVLSDPNGLQRYLNIYRLVDLFREMEEERILHINVFIEKLQGIAENERIGSLPLSEINESSIRLMTIHESKGLEFPVVFVADLQSEFRKNNEKIYFDRELGIYINIEDLINEDTGKKVEEEIKRKRLQENLRILYVAFTRAKQYLIFSLPEKPNEYEKSFSDYILKNINGEEIEKFREKGKRLKVETGPLQSRKEIPGIMLVETKRTSKRLPFISATGIREYLFCPNYYRLKRIYGELGASQPKIDGLSFHTFMEHLDFYEDNIPGKFIDYVSFLKETELWKIIQDDGNTVHREYQAKVRVDHTILNVKFDLITTGRDALIIDYKTGEEEELDKLQMLIYAYVYNKKFNRIPDRAVLVYVKNRKIKEIKFTEDEISGAEKIIKETVKNIEEERFQKNLRSCDRCPMQEICKKQN